MTGNFILPCFLVCSHVRAAFYWNLAYKNTDKFVGVRCDSVASVRHGRCYDGTIETNYLGPKTNFSKPGIYYLPTTEFVPYFVEDGTKSRDYGVNNYLLKTAPDEDLIVWHEIKVLNIMIAFFIHKSVKISNKQQLLIMILLGRNTVRIKNYLMYIYRAHYKRQSIWKLWTGRALWYFELYWKPFRYSTLPYISLESGAYGEWNCLYFVLIVFYSRISNLMSYF